MQKELWNLKKLLKSYSIFKVETNFIHHPLIRVYSGRVSSELHKYTQNIPEF